MENLWGLFSIAGVFCYHRARRGKFVSVECEDHTVGAASRACPLFFHGYGKALTTITKEAGVFGSTVQHKAEARFLVPASNSS